MWNFETQESDSDGRTVYSARPILATRFEKEHVKVVPSYRVTWTLLSSSFFVSWGSIYHTSTRKASKGAFLEKTRHITSLVKHGANKRIC